MHRFTLVVAAVALLLVYGPALDATPKKYHEVPKQVGRLDDSISGHVARRPREIRRRFIGLYKRFEANEGRDEKNKERPWSSLGLPVGPVRWDEQMGVFYQSFKGGRYGDGEIVLKPRDDQQRTFHGGAVSGLFLTWWQNVGGRNGRLGVPIGVQQRDKNRAWQQVYSGGTITMKKSKVDGRERLSPSYSYR